MPKKKLKRETIVLCLDKNYEKYAITLVEQIRSLEKNIEDKFFFEIICEAKDTITLFEDYLRKSKLGFNTSYVHVPLSDTDLEGQNHPKSAYLKCFIADAVRKSELSNNSQVLYLDVDILLQKSVSSIITQLKYLMRDYALLAVLETGPHTHHAIFSDSKRYFNSGVMFIDIGKLNDFNFTRKFLELLPELRAMPMADQDYFNILLDVELVGALPRRFNHLFWQFDPHVRKAYIIHFAGTSKPWNKYGWNRYFKAWRQYHSIKNELLKFSPGAKFRELLITGINLGYKFIFPVYIRCKKIFT
jgi:lipopolysaccharide biosynthesis glycosyltransferase